MTIFSTPHYRAHTEARQTHLASLSLPLKNKTVLEVGAGTGEHTRFFINIGCMITSTDARSEHLQTIQRMYPKVRVEQLDLDNPSAVLGDTVYDVVYCYGTLYHLSKPAEALAYMAKHCGSLLLLETCVSFGPNSNLKPVSENQQSPDQSFHGGGCRPTRPWVFEQLRGLFEYVYMPKTQPNHPEFPLDWSKPQESGLTRAVFIASRTPLNTDTLVTEIPERQNRCDVRLVHVE